MFSDVYMCVCVYVRVCVYRNGEDESLGIVAVV